MKKIGWYIILLLMMLGYHVHVDAQHISVSAPSHVAAGENFRVAYTINTSDVEEFRMGGVQDGLEVIAGPYTSSQSSYQMINGHTSSSSSVTITYTLYAAKNGSFTIGASHALVGGKRLSSRPVKIQVSGHAQRRQDARPEGIPHPGSAAATAENLPHRNREWPTIQVRHLEPVRDVPADDG